MKIHFFTILVVLFCLGCSTTNQHLNETQLAESMVFQILTQEDNTNREYCLKVLGKPPTDLLTERLNAKGQNPNSCKNNSEVYISNLNFLRGKYYVKYGYYCGDLCAAQFECVFESGTPEPIFKKCTMDWISSNSNNFKKNVEKT